MATGNPKSTSTMHRPVSVIIGLGKTGLSCARHLATRGHSLRIIDSRAAPPGAAELAELDTGAATCFGRFDAAMLDGADQVVVSPGVSLREPIVTEAVARGIDVLGDVELFAREVGGRVVGITGTNGKSTVTTLVGEMATAAGLRTRVGGNLGVPALDLLRDAPADLYVLELSSYQLESTHSLALEAATVLNVTADHLDRYVDLAEYGAAKARIFERCGTAVVNADDEFVMRMPRPGQAVRRFSVAGTPAEYALLRRDGALWIAVDGEPLLAVAEMRIAGSHNAANALAALALGDACGLPRAAMVDTLRRFAGLPHRAQFVAERRGVRYVDDSKGTNVGATLAAVAGFDSPLVLIAGGDGKGQDFTPLANAFRGKVRAAVLIGRDAPALAAALAGVCAIERAATLPEAVVIAAGLARAGDTVLLSPACASLDMFRDYAERGRVFATAVQGLEA